MTAVLHRVVWVSGNGYSRYYDDVHGAGVMYEDVDGRKCFGYVNGAYWESKWPDTSQQFDGDSGRPVNYVLRPEVDGHWYLYYYVYSGQRNTRSEWSDQVA